MLKKKLFTLATAIAITTSIMMPAKKAEAGIIVGAITGGVGGIVIAGAATGALGTGFLLIKNIDNYVNTEDIYLVAGMVILDTKSGSSEGFDTIPSYLFEEIKALTEMKASSISANSDGVKEIIFTDAEVDEIFELADENTSLEQLNNLREMLTQNS